MREIDKARLAAHGIRKIACSQKCGQDPVTGLCSWYGIPLNHYSPKCQKCKIKKACLASVDPKPIPRVQDERVGEPDELESIPAYTAESLDKIDKDAPKYSINDLVFLLRELAGCGPVVLEYIANKLDDLLIPNTELAAKYKVSRQNVSQLIKRHAKKMPWLNEFFKQQRIPQRRPLKKNGKGGKNDSGKTHSRR